MVHAYDGVYTMYSLKILRGNYFMVLPNSINSAQKCHGQVGARPHINFMVEIFRGLALTCENFNLKKFRLYSNSDIINCYNIIIIEIVRIMDMCMNIIIICTKIITINKL